MAKSTQAARTAQIEAALKAARERALIAFGDPNISGLGFGVDPTLKAQIQANYDTGNATLARLSHSNDLARQAIINSLNAHGILRSGDLGYKEGEQQRVYGNQQYDARQNLIDYLTGQAQNALDRENALQDAVNQAYMDAYSQGYTGGIPGIGNVASPYGGAAGGGSGGGGSAGPLQYSGGAQDLLSRQGYGSDQIASAVYSTLAQRGWGNYSGAGGPESPQVMENGQIFNSSGQLDPNGGYIKVKVGTPGGNSTELVYVGPPGGGSSSAGVTGGGGVASTGGGYAAPASGVVSSSNPFGLFLA